MSKQRSREQMVQIDNAGVVVPCPLNTPEVALRDQLAMSVLSGMMASEAMSQGLMKVVPEAQYKLVNAQEAYAWADAMMKAREVQ
jgi:hypothetical protein